MPFGKIFTLSNLVLVTALSLSGIAAWYSILGLVAIFAAAVIPIVIMGGALEFAKVVTTVWLHRYWDRINWQLKLYLVPAVIALALLTSMGIFGFLSKAHMDQGIVSGDVAAQISLLDEKINIQKELIKSERENIESARRALSQLDAQVSARLDRGTTEASAERSVQIRAAQRRDRQAYSKEIDEAQTRIEKSNATIQSLSLEKAPLATQFRKIEAEVGPIKYIAALIYGDNPDANLLERAVRWVIILIVLVFDPLALTLVIAANTSRRWENENATTDNNNDNEHSNSEGNDEQPDRPDTVVDEVVPNEPKPDEPEKSLLEKFPYLTQGFKFPKGWGKVPPQVYRPEVVEEPKQEEPKEEPVVDEIAEPIVDEPKEITTEGVTKEKPYKDVEGGYVVYEGKSMHKDAFTSLYPQFALMADNAQQVNTNFGPTFPKMANKGDVFVRVDILPNKVFKFDGSKWIEIQKETSNSYLYDESYIQYLVSEIDKGTYDVELLSDNERALIEEYLRTQKS